MSATSTAPAAGATGAVLSGVGILDELFAATRAEGRAALVGYLPAGYPDLEGTKALLNAMVRGGCDLIEVGMPFSDPVLDGPVVQAAQQQALDNGTRIADLFSVVESITTAGGRAVVMTYFNPVMAYGLQRFADGLAAVGGAGVITPDMIVDEADDWRAACGSAGIAPIFLVAPSSPSERIAVTSAGTKGFLYAAAVMGVTGVREQVSSDAPALVARCRQVTDLPIGVGLGVRTAAQAAEIAGYADAVIVGSAFISAAQRGGIDAVAGLAVVLSAGVRGLRTPPV